MKVIYIHIETSKRDYLSRLLLSFFATRMGFKVLLGDVLSFFKTVKNLKDKKGIFHFKDIAPSDLNLELFQSLKNNGFLITSDSLDDYVNKLIQISNNKNLLDSKRYNLKKTIERYDLNLVTNQLIDIFKNI